MDNSEHNCTSLKKFDKKTYAKNYYKKDRKKANARSREYYYKHKKKLLAQNQKWREENKEKKSARSKQYYKENKERIIKTSALWYNKRMQTDSLFAAKKKLRDCVTSAFRRIKNNKFAKTEKLLGCSYEEAKQAIESKFEEGMNWSNHGKGPGKWNIDHIRPVADFKENEIHLMNHISNLQPLWFNDNQLKKDKTDWIKL